MQGRRVAELGLEGHPGPVAEEVREGGRDGGREGVGRGVFDGYHLVEAAGEAAFVGVGVALEGEGEGVVGEERDVHGPAFGGGWCC